MFPRQALHRRNLILAILLEGFWSWGVWLSHPFTLIPVFLMRLGASTTAIGFLASLRALGSGLVVFYMGMLTAHRRRVSHTFALWHYVAILPYIGLAALALMARGDWAALWAIQAAGILLAVISSALLGGQTPIYFFLLSRLTSGRDRAWLFGVVFAIGPLVGLLGPGLAASQLGPGKDELVGYARIFAASALLGAVGTLMCFFLRERSYRAALPRGLAEQLATLIAAWRANPGLRRYLKARMWLAGVMLAIAYLATYARYEAGLSERAIALLAYFMLVAQGAGSYLLGWAGSRRRALSLPGQRGLLIQLLNLSFIVTALFFAALGPAPWAAPVLAMAAGMIIAGDMALQPNILMSLGPPNLHKDIVSLAAMVLMPFALIIPPVSGLLIEVAGHRPIFALAGLVGLKGLSQLRGLLKTPDRPA